MEQAADLGSAIHERQDSGLRKIYCTSFIFVVMTLQPAAAQWASFERPWVSSITQQELNALGEALQFTEDQQPILEALVDDHRVAVVALVTEGRAAEAKVTTPSAGTADEKERAEIARMRQVAEYADRLAELDQSFFDNVACIIEPAQQELWIAYQNNRRWQLLAQTATVAPRANVNLNRVVEDFWRERQMPPDLQELLHEYNAVMEGLIGPVIDVSRRHARNEWQRRENNRQRNEALQKVLNEKRLDLYESAERPYAIREFRTLHELAAPQVAVREINRQFAERIAAALPEQEAECFRDFVRPRLNPVWVVSVPIDSAGDRILALETLDDDQKAALQSVLDEAKLEIRSANLKLVEKEDQRFREWWRNPIAFDEMKKFQRELDDLRQRIMQLSDQGIRRMTEILTPAQCQELNLASSKPGR